MTLIWKKGIAEVWRQDDGSGYVLSIAGPDGGEKITEQYPPTRQGLGAAIKRGWLAA